MKYYNEFKASIEIIAPDCTYEIKFFDYRKQGYAWEFDPMNDTLMMWSESTGKMTVEFIPYEYSMVFHEDKKRQREYAMSIERARELWTLLRESPNYWFALDMASYFSKN